MFSECIGKDGSLMAQGLGYKADCKSLQDTDTYAIFHSSGTDSHPDGSVALMMCKFLEVNEQTDKFMTCDKGNWIPHPSTFPECPKATTCDLTELQISKKLLYHTGGTLGQNKVDNGQSVHGYCSVAGQDRITYFCRNGKWVARDSCDDYVSPTGTI
ncbi:unnamed protein product [Heligmosomoides polygyrus]|uniref:Sushi domain-containing protein n=1 Tax=Heligmosomoides polygyrus TaxID=6339 RepID=A0A183FDI6_HELPZ|nr:unnamed protein product [Heligmosomoides polygyrus]